MRKFWHIINWPNGSRSLGIDLFFVTILIRFKRATEPVLKANKPNFWLNTEAKPGSRKYAKQVQQAMGGKIRRTRGWYWVDSE